MESSAEDQLAAAQQNSPPSNQSQYSPPTPTKEPQRFFSPLKLFLTLFLTSVMFVLLFFRCELASSDDLLCHSDLVYVTIYLPILITLFIISGFLHDSSPQSSEFFIPTAIVTALLFWYTVVSLFLLFIHRFFPNTRYYLIKTLQLLRFSLVEIVVKILKPTRQKMKLSLILFVIVILNSILFSPPFTYFSFIFLGPIHEYFIYPIMLFIFFFLSFPPYPLFGISFGFDLFFDVAYLYLIACLLTTVIGKVNQARQYIYSSYSTLPTPLKTAISLSQTIGKFKKPLVVVGFLIVIIVIALYILGLQSRDVHDPKVPTDTYQSEVVVPHQKLSDAYINKYQSSSIEKVSVVYYEDNNKTYLREVETGRSVEISFTGGLFYVTPNNQYFFINPPLGQAVLIDPNSFQIINSYLFDSVDVTPFFSGSGTAWLSNFKLWINVAIFDLADSKMYRVQGFDRVFLGNVESCRDGYVSCYKVTCEDSGAPLNISGRDKLLPQTTPSLGPIGVMDYSQLQCISNRANQLVLVRSGNTLLILGVDGDKTHNYVLSISSRGEHEEEIKNAVDAQKYQSVGEFNPVDYLAGYEGPSENRMRNGKKIKFSYESIGPCLDSCELNYKTLTISNRLGIPEGRINRERIFLIGARRVHADNENGEVLFISEKGIEKIKP